MSERTHKAMPKADAVAKRVIVKARQWESARDQFEVDLIEHRYSNDEWEVYTTDGTWIGTVGRYTGSLDRKAGRLRIPGQQRTLWSERGINNGARTFFGEVSRADAIRHLYVGHKRRRQ